MDWRQIAFAKEYIVNEFGDIKDKNGCLVKQFLTKGAPVVCLTTTDSVRMFLVSRIVALTFLYNDDPEHKIHVMHKDRNPLNNCVDNLEWVTPKHNANYLDRNEKIAKKAKVPVLQFSKSGEFIKKWSCIKDAINAYGAGACHISQVCRGKRKSACGYLWFYADEFITGYTPVIKLDENENIIKIYSRISIAAREHNVHHDSIARTCDGLMKSTAGYKWMYLEDYIEKYPQKYIEFKKDGVI